MKNNAKTKISLVSILVILGVAARMMRVIHRQQIREQNRQTIQTTKKVAEFQKNTRRGRNEETERNLQKIYNESLVRNKFENWQKSMNFMVWDKELGNFISITLKKKRFLENTDQAFVLPIRHKSDNVTFQGYLAHKGRSVAHHESRREFAVATREASISAESKFVIENNVLGLRPLNQ